MLILAVTMAMADPADGSLEALVSGWKACITEAAVKWSPLPDTAEAIADASLSKCYAYEAAVTRKFQQPPESMQLADAQNVSASLRPKLRGIAMEAVMDARSAQAAKR